MSKRIVTMVLCIAVLVAVGVLVAVVLLMPSPDTDSETQTTTTVRTTTTAITAINKPVSTVTVSRMEVTGTAGSYNVVPSDTGSLVVEEYKTLGADTAMIDSMSQVLLKMTALAKPTANEDDAAYGFDKPTLTIKAYYSDDTSHTVTFGKESAGTTGYYCRVEGDDSLYIMSTSLVELFNVDAKALLSKTLIVPPSVKDGDESGAAGVLDLWLSGDCRDQMVEIITDTDAQYPGMTYTSTYVMTAPYLRAVDSDMLNLTIANMTYLVASGVAKVHPTVEDLAAYGLDDPYSVAAFTLSVMSTSANPDGAGTVTSHYNDRQHMVILGDKDENGNYYALVDEYDLVYLLSPSAVPWAEWTYYDVTNKLLFMKSISSVDSIAITANGEKTTFALTHDPLKESKDEQLTVKAGGKVYGTAEFRILYQMMIGIHRVGEKEDGATVSGEPTLAFDVTFNDGAAPMSIAFYPMTASRYLCVTDDGEEIAISISDVEDFLVQYTNYLTGAPVTSPY